MKVHEDDVDPGPALLDRMLSGCGLPDDVKVGLRREQRTEARPDDGVVVGDEQSNHAETSERVAAACAGSRMGTVTAIAVPSPGAYSTLSTPPRDATR